MSKYLKFHYIISHFAVKIKSKYLFLQRFIAFDPNDQRHRFCHVSTKGIYAVAY